MEVRVSTRESPSGPFVPVPRLIFETYLALENGPYPFVPAGVSLAVSESSVAPNYVAAGYGGNPLLTVLLPPANLLRKRLIDVQFVSSLSSWSLLTSWFGGSTLPLWVTDAGVLDVSTARGPVNAQQKPIRATNGSGGTVSAAIQQIAIPNQRYAIGYLTTQLNGAPTGTFSFFQVSVQYWEL